MHSTRESIGSHTPSIDLLSHVSDTHTLLRQARSERPKKRHRGEKNSTVLSYVIPNATEITHEAKRRDISTVSFSVRKVITFWRWIPLMNVTVVVPETWLLYWLFLLSNDTALHILVICFLSLSFQQEVILSYSWLTSRNTFHVYLFFWVTNFRQSWARNWAERLE